MFSFSWELKWPQEKLKNNAYAKFWGDKQRASWYVMVFLEWAIEIFPKGLTHGFGPKMAIFPTFLFRQYRPGKCLLRSSRTKKRLSNL